MAKLEEELVEIKAMVKLLVKSSVESEGDEARNQMLVESKDGERQDTIGRRTQFSTSSNSNRWTTS